MKIGCDSEGNRWSIFKKDDGRWGCSKSDNKDVWPVDIWYSDFTFDTEEECEEWTRDNGMDGKYVVPWWADTEETKNE